MKITDLTANQLIRLDVRDELTPLRKINYQDVKIGDILVNSPDYYDEWKVIQITGKYIKDTDSGRWSRSCFSLFRFNQGKMEEFKTCSLNHSCFELPSRRY